MKKMMKKFLSSLLALTMILSLVIVPANATDQALAEGYTLSGSFSVTANKNSVANGEQVTLTAAEITATKTGATKQPTFTYTYNWGTDTTATTEGARTATATPTTTNAAGETKTYSCTLVIMDTTKNTKVLEKTESVRVGVTNAQAAFDAAAKTLTFKGRTYAVSNHTVTIYTFTDDGEISFTGSDVSVTGYNGVTITKKKGETNVWTLSHGEAPNTLTYDVTVTESKVSADTAADALSFDKTSPITILEGQSVDVTANYKRDGSQNVSYSWTRDSAATTGLTNSNKAKVTYTAPDSVSSSGESHKLTCLVKEGDSPVTSKDITIEVTRDPYSPAANGTKEYAIAPSVKDNVLIKAPYLKPSSSSSSLPIIDDRDSGFSIKWEVANDSKNLVTVDQSSGLVTAKSGTKSGTATVTATITYNLKTYPAISYTVVVTALDNDLGKITNGDNESYSYSEIEDLVVDAIKKMDKDFTYRDVKSIYTTGTPNRVTVKGDGKSGIVESSLTVTADKSYIGTGSFQLKVNNKYVVTLYVTIEGKDKIQESVTGTASGKDVTFTNSDYDYLYIYEGSASFKSDMYEGDWSKGSRHGDWKPVKKNSDYTVKSSAFDRNGKATLYVVAVDDDIASTGTITVSQKSYDIKYNVVAGETLSFDQKAFESFMNDYADDNIKTSKGDYFEFDYVKFTSLPNSTREGTLYEGKDKIKTSTEVENLDKVSFESVAKAKDTIKVPFTLYAKQYDKNDKVIDKKVSMTGEVVISVVKEDIVFEVGVNSAIKLGSDKFIDFLRDSDKSYKKADLDYVTFDVGKNSAITSYFNGTGALYRYYNGSTGINATVSAKDEFYYNPKTSSKHYDLDDVAYVTSKFAKVGDIVYIPFTAYGTKSGQKAEGTLAIKVKQTMNFVDVRPGDYFYDSVQWAVNLDITKGTSATTFSPKQGCTRAQIVTFLWRAAGSPEPKGAASGMTDVVSGSYYEKAVAWAIENGITTGTTTSTFSPDATCTRAQAVTFLYRASGSPAVSGKAEFSDVSTTAFYADAVAWAAKKGITTGIGGGLFGSDNDCTRGQIVTFLWRAMAE